MKTAIKILSIISLIFACIGIMIALLCLTILWEPTNVILDNHINVIESGPIIPLGEALHIIGVFLISLVLLVTYKSNKINIIEFLSILLISIGIPFLGKCIDSVQLIWIDKYFGDGAYNIISETNHILSLPIRAINLSAAICMLTSGMRIIDKIALKKELTITVASIISIITSTVSLLLAIVMLTILWRPIAAVFVSSLDIINNGAIFPIGSMVYILVCMVIAIILFFRKKVIKAIAVEILFTIMLGFVLPSLTSLLAAVQQSFINASSTFFVTIFTISNRVMSPVLMIVDISFYLSLAVCGMLIAYKIHCKSTNQSMKYSK